jgi:hypothetical protein
VGGRRGAGAGIGWEGLFANSAVSFICFIGVALESSVFLRFGLPSPVSLMSSEVVNWWKVVEIQMSSTGQKKKEQCVIEEEMGFKW